MRAYNYPMAAVAQHTLRYPDCLGVEIEWEHFQMLEANRFSFWRTEHDGSLRNNGIEFISAPLDRTDYPLAFTELRHTMGTAFTARSSERCGVHIHLNVLGMNYGQFMALCVAYAAAEPGIMAYCGELRNDNVFCVPWFHTPDQLRLLSILLATARQRPRAKPTIHYNRCRDYGLPQFNKYQAVNLMPIWEHGTMEFRMAPTWESLDDIEAWGERIRALHDLAVNIGNPDDMADMITTSGPEIVWEAMRLPVVGEPPYMDEGVDLAMELAGDIPVDWRDLDWEVPDEPMPVAQRPAYRVERTDPWGQARTMRGVGIDMFEMDEYPEEDEYEDEEEYEEDV